MSGWQHEPQRGVHPLLYTTHHRALCTLKVHRADAPNDDVYGVFMTDLGWLPPLSPCGASASPAAVGAGLSLFFCLPCHQKYTWNSNVHGNAWHAHFLFCCLVHSAHAHHFSLLSLSLYIFCITPNTLSVPQYQ